MPRATAHRVVAGATIGIAIAYKESLTGQSTAWPVAGGGLGALFGTLPDILEPADDPNHRQFFHSLAFAGVLGYAGYKLYEWTPEEPWQEIMRKVGLIGISACLIHLAMDVTTPRSLPILGA